MQRPASNKCCCHKRTVPGYYTLHSPRYYFMTSNKCVRLAAFLFRDTDSSITGNNEYNRSLKSSSLAVLWRFSCNVRILLKKLDSIWNTFHANSLLKKFYLPKPLIFPRRLCFRSFSDEIFPAFYLRIPSFLQSSFFVGD